MDNNEARKKFKAFISEWGLETSGRRNVFKDSGKLWAYAADNSTIELRQFYEDCSGVFCNGNFIPKEALTICGVSRISPSGLKAYTVRWNS